MSAILSAPSLRFRKSPPQEIEMRPLLSKKGKKTQTVAKCLNPNVEAFYWTQDLQGYANKGYYLHYGIYGFFTKSFYLKKKCAWPPCEKSILWMREKVEIIAKKGIFDKLNEAQRNTFERNVNFVNSRIQSYNNYIQSMVNGCY